MHSAFLDVWWRKQHTDDTAGIVQLLTFSTFVGVFSLIVASVLWFKRTARLLPPIAKVVSDAFVATFCVVAGSVSEQ